MVPDSERLILGTVFAEIHDAGRLGDVSILASDNLKDLGLSRLRLLALLIELEDKFDIEFPHDAVDSFRIVTDIAVYIQSHAMMPYDAPDKRPAVASPPIGRHPPARGRLRQFCGRAFCHILKLTFGSRGPDGPLSGSNTEKQPFPGLVSWLGLFWRNGRKPPPQYYSKKALFVVRRLAAPRSYVRGIRR